MRPRIKKPDAVLVAHSSNTAALERIPVDRKDKRPFVMIFDKKLYINPNEIDYYTDQGFTVFQSI